MAKPITYTATAPDGSVITRKSHRSYSHAVLVRDMHKGTFGWRAFAWCGRADLAAKKRGEAQNALQLEIEVVEVAA